MARQQVLGGTPVKVDFDLQGRFAIGLFATNTDTIEHHLTMHFLPPDQQPPNVTQPSQILDFTIPPQVADMQLAIPPGYSINIDWGNPQCTVEWVNLN